MSIGVTTTLIEPATINTVPDSFKPNRNLGIILSFISLFLIGTFPIISNSRPMELDALHYTLYLSIWQFIFATPLFMGDLFKANKGIFDKTVPTKVKNKTLIVILLTGIVFLCSTFIYILSFQKAGAINTSIAVQAFPVFSIILESIVFSKMKNKEELFFTALLILALTYLGTNGTFALEKLSYWFLVALIVPILWTIAHITIKHFLDNSPITPGQVVFFRVAVASCILFILIILTEGPLIILNDLMNVDYQFFALAMGFVYYTELVNWFYALKHVDVSVAGSITTPTPVVTMILALMFLHETLHDFQLIALIIVCIGLYGLLYAGSRKEKKLWIENENM